MPLDRGSNGRDYDSKCHTGIDQAQDRRCRWWRSRITARGRISLLAQASARSSESTSVLLASPQSRPAPSSGMLACPRPLVEECPSHPPHPQAFPRLPLLVWSSRGALLRVPPTPWSNRLLGDSRKPKWLRILKLLLLCVVSGVVVSVGVAVVVDVALVVVVVVVVVVVSVVKFQIRNASTLASSLWDACTVGMAAKCHVHNLSTACICSGHALNFS